MILSGIVLKDDAQRGGALLVFSGDQVVGLLHLLKGKAVGD